MANDFSPEFEDFEEVEAEEYIGKCELIADRVMTLV